MNNNQILTLLKQKNIEIGVVDGKLKILDPDKNLDTELLTLLKAHKEDLIRLITQSKLFTPSDFPNAALDKQQLAKLQHDYPSLENLYIATPMQSGFLFHGMDDAGASYVSLTHCDLVGTLNVDAFTRAWQHIIARYQTFRTCFVGLDEKQIHQLVQSDVTMPIIELDWRNKPEAELPQALADYRVADKAQGFDFQKPPLMRVSLIRVSDERFHLVWSHHHVLSDGWCLPIVFGEVMASYQGYLNNTPVQLPPVVPYEHYISWLRKQDKNQARAFWTEHLSEMASPTPLTIDKLPPQSESEGRAQGPDSQTLLVSDAVNAGLNALAKSVRCTMNVIVQAAWSVLVQRYSGESEVIFGSTVSGRPAQLAGIEKMIGLFINTLPVRARLGDKITLGELLQQLHRDNVACDEYSYLGLGEIQGLSELPNGMALFDSLIVYENYPTELGEGQHDSVGFAVEAVGSGDQTNFGLLLNAFDNDQLTLEVSYRLERFSRATIERLMGHLEQIVTAMAAGGAQLKVNEIELLSEAEKQNLLVDWNASEVDYAKGQCLHQLFESQAQLHPNNTAVICGSKELSYSELNERSNRLAHHLMAQGVGPDTLIGLSVERSLEVMVGLFAILKAGAAYIPLDPSYPTARLEYMLSDSAVKIIITQRSLVEILPLSNQQVLCLDDAALDEAVQNCSTVNPVIDALTPSNLIYVIYTSGSTGQPKGVLVEHHSVVNFLQYSSDTFLPEHVNGALVSAPLAFDGTVCTLYTPFLQGKYVELLPAEDTAIDLLADYIFDDEDPLLFKLTPAHLEALLSQGNNQPNPEVEHVFVIAGELLTEKTLAPWRDELLPNSTFFNEYGPTEASVGTTVYKADKGRQAMTCSGNVPIGEPLANAKLYVLGPNFELQPTGTPGELYIGGAGLARGYLNQPAMTAERFVDNPFTDAAADVGKGKMYKTGDLVKWLPDGNIEFINRIDNQVKLRGFRIELGEIENQLGAISGVREAVVLCREDEGHAKRLVAYVVPTEKFAADDSANASTSDKEALSQLKLKMAAEYIDTLNGCLPEYMVPQVVVFMDQFPLSPNGKVNRRTLPVPEEADLQKQQYVAPRNEIEQTLCGIWQEVLGLEQVGIHDSFFGLGGHSLLAIRLISMVREKLEVEIPVRILFDKATVASLAEVLPEYNDALVLDTIAIADRAQALALSYAQQRLWFIDRMEGSTQYNMPGGFELEGALNIGALEQSVRTIIERHEVLRTGYITVDGEPVQNIRETFELPLLQTDFSALDEQEQRILIKELANEDALKPFDLSKDLMLRVKLITLTENRHVVLFNLHHIASDGWSTGVLIREFSALYNAYAQQQANPLAPLRVQYADYAIWHRNWLQGEALDNQLNYWQQQLAGIPQVHSLPLDNPRPSQQTYSGAAHAQMFDKELAGAINGLCQAQEVTIFMLLQSAFSLLLGRYSGESDIVIGSPIAGRVHQDVEQLIGFFVNTLVLRTDLSDNPSFIDLLARNKQTVVDAYTNQHIPFEMLVEAINPERDLSHSPLFQVMLSLQNNERLDLGLTGLDHHQLQQQTLSVKLDLELKVSEREDGISLQWLYNKDLFVADTIATLADNFRRLLKAIVATPKQPVYQLPMLGETQKHSQLTQWNDTATNYPDELCVHRLFESQTLAHPAQVAVSDEQQSLTYQQLNAKSNRLAHHLIECGVKPDAVVGLCIERSTDMLVAVMAILKAGGAYVPLDPEYPQARLKYIMDDTAAQWVISHSSVAQKLPEQGAQILCLDDEQLQQSLQSYSEENPGTGASGLNQHHLAYLIYTSGSTGQPKGVMIEHQAIVNRLDWMQSQYPLDSNDKVLQKTPYSFDVSVWELLWAVSVGAQLVFAKPQGHKEPEYLKTLIQVQGITTLHFVPSMLKVMLDTVDWSQCTSVRQVFCSGEALSPSLVKDYFAVASDAKLHNLYGPTEAAIDVSYFDCDRHEAFNGLPIGKPINNIQLHVLDRYHQLQPVGTPGELHIGGVGLARGYLNQPQLSAEKFIPNPLNQNPLNQNPLNKSGTERLYKTGDLVRWLPQGELQYLGRIDDQIKIRGFRIELGEIESQLLVVDDVEQAVVMCREDEGVEKRLVGYVVSSQDPKGEGADGDEEAQEARAEQKQTLLASYTSHLNTVLPEYMVPGIIILLDELPLTANGKVNKKALPVPGEADLQRAVYIAPSNETETLLSEIWQELLQLDQIGMDDNFFALGGHSLLAVKMDTRVQQQLNKRLPLKQLFETPTIAGVAKYLNEYQSDGAEAGLPQVVIDKPNEELPFPQTGVQQAYVLGRSDAFALGNVAAHKYTEYNVPAVDVTLLSKVWNFMIQRHGILRTVFNQDGTQKILKDVPEYQFDFVDVRKLSEQETESTLMGIRDALSHQVFEVEIWPLFEIRICQLGDDHFRLHISMDLLLLDGSSSRLLEKEFRSLYENPDFDVEPLELTFRDYVLAEQAVKKTPLYRQSRDYWIKRLDDLPMAPALPLAKDPAEIIEPRFGRHQFKLEPARWRQLKARINHFGVTPTVFMMTVYSLVMNRWTKNNRFTLNLTLFNRMPVHEEVEVLLGDFTSLNLLEVEVRTDESLADNAKRIQSQLWDDLEHRYFGGTEVLRELNRQSGSHQAVSMPMVFTSALALTNDGLSAEGKSSELEKLTLLQQQDFGTTQTSQVWLDHQVSERRGGLVVTWDAIDEIFPVGMWDEIFDAYSVLLNGLIVNDIKWNECYTPELPKAQAKVRTATNATEADRGLSTLHGPFLEQVSKNAQRVAVIAGDTQLSYGQVDAMAGHYAKQLNRLSAQPNTLVAVVMNKGWEQVVATMAILYAGAAYLPIDGGLPPERIHKLLALGEVDIALTEPELAALLEWPAGIEVIPVNAEHSNLFANGEKSANSDYFVAAQSETDLAYVIFTSGSTGEPKGVVIDHQGAANTIADINEKFSVTEQDKTLALSALNFDLSVYDIFGLLAAGGALVMPQVGKEKEPGHWLDLVEQHGVSLWNTVPALAQLYVEQLQMEGRHGAGDSLRVFLLSGDWIPLGLPDTIVSQCTQAKVIGLGGATEASIWSIYYPIDRVDPQWKSIPYGKPLENQRFYVLKADLSEALDWVVGDLYIGGIGVAKGYWRDQQRTDASFIIHPDSGERLYKTGDLGRFLPDGNIEFLGREDSQVKVHGHRIELGEIESVLSKHDDINDAIVLALGENRHNKSLVAYIQPSAGNLAADQANLLAHSNDGGFELLQDNNERMLFKMEQAGLRHFPVQTSTLALPGKPDATTRLSLSDATFELADINTQTLALSQLGQWLSCLAQVKIEGHLLPKRYYPSAGSLYPLQAYCYIKPDTVEGAQGGFYYYDPSSHQLVLLNAYDSHQNHDELLPSALTEAAFALFLVADQMAMGPLYGGNTERFCLIETGHAQQLLCGAASAQGIGVVDSSYQTSAGLHTLLELQENHRVTACLLGGHTTVAAAPQSASIDILSRQSYREYLADSIDRARVEKLLAQMPQHAQAPQLYVYSKAGRVDGLSAGFYRYDVAQQQLVPADNSNDVLKSNHDVGLTEGFYGQSAFSLYLVGNDASDNQVVQAGALGQALMNHGSGDLIGLCPAGTLAFDGVGESMPLLYSFEGGLINEQQTRQWPAEVASGKKDVEAELREYLLARLPSYMAPTVYVVMDKFPLTANGKVNRNALPEPAQSDLQQQAYMAPTNETERKLCQLWQELLAVDKIGIQDNFFTLGGHSLLAVKLGALVQSRFHQPLPLKQLFVTPTIAGVAQYLEQNQDEVIEETLPVIEVDEANQHLPFALTGVQQAYLFGRSNVFALGNVSTHGYSELNLAELDVGQLTHAWNQLIHRHGMLRAVFSNEGTQRILEQVPEYEIAYVDLQNASTDEGETQLLAIREQLSHQVFAVDQWPLFELRVTRVGAEHYRVHFSIDLLLTDASSSRILSQQLYALYAEPDTQLRPLSLSFRDYVLAEQAIEGTPIHNKARDYWVKRLDTLPMAPALPLIKDPAEVDVPKFKRREFKMNASQWRALQDKISDWGVTPTVFLLTLFSQVLGRWSKNDKFTLNLTLFNRLPMHDEVNQLVGDFTSLTLLEMDATANRALAQSARDIHERLWDDLEHRHFGGIEVLRALNSQSGGNQAVTMPVVFTSALGLGGADQSESQVAPLMANRGALADMDYGISQTSQVWLDHQVSEGPDGLSMLWDAIEELFPDTLLDEMFDAYTGLITGLASELINWHECFRSDLPQAQLAGRSQVNATDVDRPVATMHGLFLEQVAAGGHRMAVQSSEMTLSYTQLDNLAGRLAKQLNSLGAKPNKLIAVVMEKGWEQVVATMGILYSGGAYLPIDGGLPQERINQLLALGQVDIAVCQAGLVESLQWPQGIEVLSVSDEGKGVKDAEQYFIAPLEPTDLAYVIFTSGSTGEPKGVVIDHQGAANTLIDINGKFNVGEQDKAIALSALNFDLSVYDIFGMLGAGGAVVMPQAGKEKDPAHWAELVEQFGVTLWNTVPALAQLYVEQVQNSGASAAGIRVYLLSGDWLPMTLPTHLKAASPQGEVVSLGGATEASIWSIYYPIGEIDSSWKSIPYGKPLENQRFHVLKSDYRQCPDWVIGDLYIAGIGLAKGYWRDEHKTNASFVTHPDSGERLYKTGDLGRYFPDGNIEFLGREDTQVKVHGHRIELGEIESVLNKHDQINDSIVLALGESRHNKSLVAYIQPSASNNMQGAGMKILDDNGECEFELLKDNAARMQFKMDQMGLRRLAADQYTQLLPHKPVVATPLKLAGSERDLADITAQMLPRALELDALGQWLSCLAQVSIGGHAIGKRFYPSAGSLYPVQAYLYLKEGAVAGMCGGYYYYDPATHQLKMLDNAMNQQGLPAELGQLPLAVFLVADTLAMGPVYGGETDRFCQLESGHIQQLLSATSVAQGIGLAVTHLQADNDLRDRLKLESHHRVTACLVGAHIDVPIDLATTALSCLDRQSYREHSSDALERSSIENLLVQLQWQDNYPQVYLYGKASRINGIDSGFYCFDVASAQFVAADDDALQFNNDSGVNEDIYQQSAFSLYLVGQDTSAKQYLAAGHLSQALMNLSCRFGIGLCAIGSSAFETTSDGNALLYSMEGGAISDEQRSHWPEATGNKKDVKSELQQYLAERLPSYMAPVAYVVMEKFPLTANGKVNRKALPEPSELDTPQREYVAPSNETEEKLCAIWCEVLELEQVGVKDNFFELGGNSLSAIKVMNLIRERFDLGENELTLTYLFKNPFLDTLADALLLQSNIDIMEQSKQQTEQLLEDDLELGEL
jgi:amino acid adenylation domain-containing protein